MAFKIKNMIKNLFLFVVLFQTSALIAQINSVQNFWEQTKGDKESFIINGNGELQLAANTAGQKYLMTPFLMADSLQWKVEVELQFSPSTSNTLKFYLFSDAECPDSSSEAFFFKIGKTGATDGLELYHKREGKDILLQELAPGSLSKTNNNLSVTLVKTGNFWDIQFIPNQDTAITWSFNLSLGSAFKQQAFFGPWCKVTSSNTQGISFDKIELKAYIIDKTAPQVVSQKLSDSLITISFSENIADATIINFSPANVDFKKEILGQQLKIYLPKNLPNKTPISFTLNTKDLAGNYVLDTLDFFYFYPEPLDLIISEIMYKPSPSLGVLDETEYIELFNNSEYTINLTDISLSVDNKDIQLPEFNLKSKEYAVVDEQKNTNNNYSSIHLNSWFTLLYGGSNVKLKYKDKVLHQILYQPYELQNAFKEEGGWSLELGMAQNACLGFKAWNYSNSKNGGTPGAENAYIFESNDNELKIINVFYESDTSIYLVLNVQISEFENQNLWSDLEIKQCSIVQEFSNKILVEFAQKMEQGKIYQIALNSGITSCLGEVVDTNSNYRFAKPDAVQVKDVLFNELMFNPSENGSEYFELYNKSTKTIDLSLLKVAVYNSEQQISSTYLLSPFSELLFPGEYICFVEDENKLIGVYPKASKVFQMQQWPNLNNESGNYGLIQLNGETIDQLNYQEDWHYQGLADHKGVSLERINPQLETQNKANWTSASYSENYGTPGKVNSQFITGSVTDENFSCPKKYFTPNNDGIDDVLEINYQCNQNNKMVNINLYSDNGEFVKSLYTNVLLGTSGTLIWDGTLENNTVISAGNYVLDFVVSQVGNKEKKQKMVISVNR